MISVKINDVTVNVDNEIVATRNRLEQTDIGSLTVFNQRSSRYEPYTRVELDTEQYLIESDNLIQQRGINYEHQLTLIENIAIASTIFPVDRSFKRVPALRLKDILAIYKRELYFYQNFLFTYDDDDTIYNTKIVDKEYAGVDFAVILYDLFRSINAIPRLTWNNGWVLSYELYTATNNLLTLNIDNKTSSVNDIDYATNLLAKTRNAVSEDTGYIYWPGANSYMTPRAKGTLYKTSDLQFELDSDVMALYEAVASVKANVYTKILFEGSPVDTVEFDVDVDVDFTQSVKESDVYESLLIYTGNLPANPTYTTLDEPTYEGEFYKQGCVRWTKESNVIDALWWKQDGIIFDESITALKNAIESHISQAIWNERYDLIENAIEWRVELANIETEDIPIRVKYRPRRDIDFITEKQRVSGFNKATILNNQKDTTIEIGRYLENSNAIVNRIGNDIINLTQPATTWGNRWQLGDYFYVSNTRWVIINVKYSVDKSLVVSNADFAVNFSNVNRETAITRQPSPYVYTGKGVQSNFIYKEYMVFDESLAIQNNTILTDFAQRIAVNIFDYSATYDKPLRHMIYSRVGSIQNIDKQLFAVGSGNVMLFHAAFNDARIAGKAFRKYQGGWYQDPIWYVSQLTEALSTCAVNFTHEHSLITDLDDYKYYPLVNDDDDTYTERLLLPLDKDPNDQLAITYELLTVSQSENIIIGNGFTRFNNLVRELGSASLTVYSNTEPYTIFDKLPKGTLLTGATVTLNSNYVEILDSLGEAIQYWCLVYDNEIIMAGNNSVSQIYFSFAKTREYGDVIGVREVDAYFYNEFTLSATSRFLLRLANPEFENTFTLTATMFLFEIFAQFSTYFENNFSFTFAHATGTYEWENSDVTYYNSASNKVTAYVDTTGTPRPSALDYPELTALRLYAYNMTASSSGEYSFAGTQLDLASATIVVSNSEDVEDVLQAENPTAWATFIAGNMTDTVLKVTDANLTVTYWKPTYPLHGYYKNIFVEI